VPKSASTPESALLAGSSLPRAGALIRLLRLLRRPIYYPSSFLKLIIAGFLLVSLPLIFAIVNNAVSIHEIVERSQRTVQQAVQATQTSRLIIEQANAMERSVRQFTALGDAALLEGYDHARVRFLEAAQRMGSFRLDAEQSNQLKTLKQRELDIAQAVEAGRSKPASLAPLLAEFRALDVLAQALDDMGSGVVEREVASLQSVSEGVQRFIFWQLVALVPVALFIVVGAIILISRPISQIDAAIRRLGEGDFGSRVEVQGPEDLQHLGRQLEWMRLRLIDLEEQKTRFLRHVSHELKTPLASLKEGIDLLEEQVLGDLSPAQREVATILKQSTQRLQRLIEDLLSFHTAQYQRGAVAFSPVPLSEVIARAGQQHRLTIASKGLQYQVDCPAIVLEADQDKLAAVVDNLVSNAVKFSPTGGRILVMARSNGQEARLEVVDEGPGIAQEEREAVFEPFFQGSTPYQGPVKGTGLGLAIVKEFVAAHRGRVEIVDGGRGAHIRVSLPLTQKQLQAA
jgi:two-component system sensor histidine kinase GlrK